MKAPLPGNEESRLKTLCSLDLLDTDAESEFDELTILAAQICDVPVALISLVDEKRQWFKSKVGLELTETNRDFAFCAHAILKPSEIMEISDTHLDKRFADNPLVTQNPKIRFYAGAPLIISNGDALGTLCIIDFVPRKLSSSQRTALDVIRLLVISKIEIREKYRELDSFEGSLYEKKTTRKAEIEHSVVSVEQEMALHMESELLSRRILDMSMDGVITVNQQGEVIYWNPKAEQIFGYTARYAQHKVLIDLVVEPREHPAIKKRLKQFLRNGERGLKRDRFEMMAVSANGQRTPIEIAVIAIKRYGEYIFTGFVRDLTERNKNIEDLRVSAITFNSQEGIIITDGDIKIIRVNKAFTDITGYPDKEVVGADLYLLQSAQHGEDFYSEMWREVKKNDGWEGEVWVQHKNDEALPLHLTITAIRAPKGAVSNYVLTFSDITSTKKDANEIYNLAFFDPLTGLPNRRLLMDRLSQAVASSSRSGEKAALLFIDLDNFKDLNDTLGHDYGDVLLTQTAERLKHNLRIEDTVARIGGDEFVVILQSLGEDSFDAAAQTEIVATKILSSLNQPYFVRNHECFSSASIGATLFHDHQAQIDELLKQADIAMYQAKKSGRNMLCFFDPEMQNKITQRINMEHALRGAVENEEFQLYYQLQVNDKQTIVGAEALIRWEHPTLGVVSPIDFIPLAEESGLILEIGNWVIKTACEQLKSWQKNPLTMGLSLAVNISARQFFQRDFVDDVLAYMNNAGVDPCLLKLELTESLILDDVNETIVKMNKLKKVGVEFSLDDFGTGYSSLAYLTQLPLSQLKIDQSFVRNIGIQVSDSIIVKTIVGMSKSLGFEVVAEGVETQYQYDFLEALDCHLFQGYLFSKPVPVAEFENLL